MDVVRVTEEPEKPFIHVDVGHIERLSRLRHVARDPLADGEPRVVAE